MKFKDIISETDPIIVAHYDFKNDSEEIETIREYLNVLDIPHILCSSSRKDINTYMLLPYKYRNTTLPYKEMRRFEMPVRRPEFKSGNVFSNSYFTFIRLLFYKLRSFRRNYLSIKFITSEPKSTRVKLAQKLYNFFVPIKHELRWTIYTNLDDTKDCVVESYYSDEKE